jgi:hypothetical protein
LPNRNASLPWPRSVRGITMASPEKETVFPRSLAPAAGPVHQGREGLARSLCYRRTVNMQLNRTER